MNGFRLCLLTLSGLGANAALGQVVDNDAGLYVGAGLGNYSTEIDSVDDLDLDFDEDESASRIFAGWRFNNFVAVEVDRYDFGESSAAAGALNVSTDTRGWAPSVIGTLPLGPIELFARAGMLFYDVELSLNEALLFDESGENPVYSAGLGFTVLERLNFRLEYEVIDIDEYDDAEAAWLTAAWRF